MKRQRLKSNKSLNKFKIKPLVIILGEGETEESYINRLTEIEYFDNARIKFEKGDERNFESKLKEHLNNKENVFVILDIDNEQKDTPRYDKIKHLLEKYQSQVFYNNFSFETWLLNHKTPFARPISHKEQYDLDIKRNFDIDSWSGNKNKQNRDKLMSNITKDTINNACSNTKQLQEQNWNNNPSSNCSDMITKIKEVRSD